MSLDKKPCRTCGILLTPKPKLFRAEKELANAVNVFGVNQQLHSNIKKLKYSKKFDDFCRTFDSIFIDRSKYDNGCTGITINSPYWLERCVGFRLREIVGFVELGKGSYSKVFTCPWNKKKAIKIGLKPTEDGWLNYARLCIKHSDRKNPLLMGVHNLIITDNYYIAVIDKYSKTVWRAFYDEVAYANRNFTSRKAMRGKITATVTTLQTSSRFASPETDSREYREYAAEFKKLCLQERVSYRDLHEENFMVHGKRLVITDPDSSYPSHAAIDELHQMSNVRKVA